MKVTAIGRSALHVAVAGVGVLGLGAEVLELGPCERYIGADLAVRGSARSWKGSGRQCKVCERR